jgi:hypothetical protein
LFEKECDLTVALFFKVVYNGTTAELSLAQNLFYFLQVFVLKRDFKQVVCVVDWENFNFTLSGERVNLVAEEETEINWLFNALESS